MTIMQHVNGTHARGRTPPSLGEHTFKDSGITIKIRKVGPTTQQRAAQAIQREMPEPQPPIVETEDMGAEANPADPAYLKRHEEWEGKTTQELTRRLMLLAALEAEVTIDGAIREEIARKKRHLKLSGIPYEDNPDLDADENARVFYVLQIACATPDDLNEFGDAVLRRSVPTEEAVAKHISTFPSDVPGSGSVQLPADPEVGD